jgi:hypothetical protein
MRSDQMNAALDLLPAHVARFDRAGVQRYMDEIQTPEQAQAFAQLLLEHPKDALSHAFMASPALTALLAQEIAAIQAMLNPIRNIATTTPIVSQAISVISTVCNDILHWLGF